MWRTIVDLPLPESPITQKISPRRTENETSATPTTHANSSSTSALPSPRSRTATIASSARSPNIFHNRRHSTAGVCCECALSFIVVIMP